MIILVTGGRFYQDRDKVFSILDWYHERHGIETIINGGAPGLDTLSIECCISNNIEPITVLAEWDKHKRAAGHIRNRKMFELFHDDIDLVLAFPGGPGTRHCIKTAKKFGFDPIIIGEE